MSYSGIPQQIADNRPHTNTPSVIDHFNNNIFLLINCNETFVWKYKGELVVVLESDLDKVFIRYYDYDKSHLDGWIKKEELLITSHT